MYVNVCEEEGSLQLAGEWTGEKTEFTVGGEVEEKR
jgi:hypothetical protein